MATHTEWITQPERLAEIAAEWDLLAEDDPAPFSRHIWITAWWRAFGGERELRVCTVWDEDNLVAALPLVSGGGRGLRSTTNAHTPTYRPLARDPTARAGLAQALMSTGEFLKLEALPASEREIDELLGAVSEGGIRTTLDLDFVSPVTGTSGAFEPYQTERKPHWRELERRARKLEREHAVEHVLIARPADLERDLADGFGLEAAGWKGREGTAMLSDEVTARFYGELAHAFHASDELRISSLRSDGRLVAFDLALVHRGRYYLLKTAFDEDLRTLAPGLVLRRAVIERCFDLGLEAHEFLGIDMEWKRLFANGERRHFVWRAYPGGVTETLRYAYRRRARPVMRSAYRLVRRPD